MEDLKQLETFVLEGSRIKHEVEVLQHEEALATTKSQAQHEAENLKEKKTFTNTRSLVKHEVENLRRQETFVVKRSLVKHEVEDLQQEKRLQPRNYDQIMRWRIYSTKKQLARRKRNANKKMYKTSKHLPARDHKWKMK